MKEETKIFKIDEADVLLAADEKIKKYFSFDKHQQRIKIRKQYDEDYRVQDLPDWLEIFLSEDDFVDSEEDPSRRYHGYLNEELYYKTFMNEFYEVINSGALELPEGLSLSSDYTPCEVCTNKDNAREQFVRCRHQPDCQDHKKKMTDRNHEETCNCRVFTSPCLSFSKIGLALHLEFTQPGGDLLNLDIDINPPALPVSRTYNYKSHEYDAEFDGRNVMKRERLEREREKLVDWKTEWNKSEDNSEAAGEDDGLKRSVRLRFFNQRNVISEQVGNNILLGKVLKNIFSPSASYSTEKRTGR